MANTTQEAPKYDVLFVKTGDSLEEATETLKLAFEAMESSQLEPNWITVADCLKITKNEHKLFVLDPFQGVAFEHLKTYKCRIVGPLCILYCLQYSDVLPKRPYPVYSVSMRKITVACSNIKAKMREEISERVQLMGGFFSKDLTKSVTHLIVGEVGSQKYKVAANFGLPIMTPDWVTDVWENGQYKQLHATDSVYDKYKCPVFKGLIISVSQLSAEERLTLKRVIEDNGGSYSGALKASETTHLVLSEPSGDKYRFARSWKVYCVNVKWIFDSVEAGYCRDEALYGLDDATQTQPKRSTPKKDLTSIDLPVVDCSVITGNPTVSHLDETIKSEVSFPVLNKRNSFVPLEEFNLSTLPKYGQFLDGCKIFLTGFTSPHMDKLRKIVNSGGGMRFNKYSDSVSHVVCGEITNDFIKILKSSSVKPFVVSYSWLLECCKNDKLVDEKPFLCLDVTTFSPEKNEAIELKKDIPLHMSQNSSQAKKDDFTTDDNMTDIFKQYINDQLPEDDKENNGAKFEAPNGTNLKTKSLSTSVGKGHLEEKCNDVFQAPIPVIDLSSQPEAAPQANVETHVDMPDNELSNSENLFAGLKFVIVGFGQKDTEILSTFIETHSGVVCTEKNSVCDIAIVPLIWDDLTIPVSNIITNCWLQKCVEESRIFDFDENALFRPFSVNADMKPFKSFVISFSQYVGTERDCLIHLAESLGATCQEYFVRKANAAKGVLSNTHLVVSLPNGSKYEASKKWKIPAVTKRWVTDAAKLGVSPAVEDYLVDKFPELPLSDEVPKAPQVASENRKVTKSVSSSEKKNDTSSSLNVCAPETSNQSVHNISARPSTSNTSIKCPKPQENEKSLPEAEQVECPEPLETDKLSSEQKLVECEVKLVPLQHSRIAELCNESRRESMSKSSPIRPISDNSLDASLNLDQTHNFKFHVSSLLNDLDASVNRESVGSNKRQSLPVEEMFSRNLASALHRLDGKSNMEKEGDNSKVLEGNSQEDKKCTVLSGVVLYVSRKLSSLQIELNDIVVKLGGSYVWSGDDPFTHFVFVGKPNDITKEFREARSRGKKIVSPDWIYACRDKQCYVEEELYPHTYKPNMSLSQQISIVKVPTTVAPKDIPESKPHKKDCETTNEPLQSDSTPVSSKSEEADFNKQLNELLVAAKSAKKRNSKRMVSSTSSSPVTEKSPIPKYQRHLSDVYIRPSTSKDNAVEEPDTCSQHSQSYPITWDDPTGRQEREKIAARAAKMAEVVKKARIESRNKELVEEIDLGSSPTETEKPEIRKFMFTNIADSLKVEYIEIIKKLGGEVSDEKAFDITATHLILANPIKNEKFLSSVASGKWVLHPLYLSASAEQSAFVSEEEYEWGGPSTEKFVKNIPANNAKIADCPHRWRTKVQQGIISAGAFDSWTVVIHADDKTKHSTYTKILEAGGAKIIPSENSESSLNRITHVFVDVKKRGPNKIDLSCYLSHNIKCVKPEYLAFYLIDDPPPDVESFLISEAQESLATSGSSKRRNFSTSSRQSKRTKVK